MENTNAAVSLVYTQYVESYSDSPSQPYFKFKGGAIILVPTDRKQTAIGLVLQKLAKEGRSGGEYPTQAIFFNSEAEAIASVDEWERDGVERIGIPVA